jgi:hypothetical protein
MAVLINRNPSGRLICLHALVQTLNKKFDKKEFSINDLKYDSNLSVNITDFCELLTKISSVKDSVCPYLDNPTSKAKCYLTQSIQRDTQKSKSASDAMNALDGLGLVSRGKATSKLTSDGSNFAKNDFSSKKWLELSRKAVLGYGPFVGLLYEISKLGKSNPIEVSKSQINLGFPQTKETIRHESKLIPLSMGSQDDTITRTRSVLFSWAISTGFATPSNYDVPNDASMWHVYTRDFVEKEKWLASKYKFFIPKNLFDGDHYVERPLNYSWLTKSIRALRERGQESIRKFSLIYESRVKNRRFAIAYVLAKCAEEKIPLDFKQFTAFLKEDPEYFVIGETKFEQIMAMESKIAILCGIPFDYNRGIMTPLTRINVKELSQGAPSEVVKKLNDIYNQLKSV